MVCFPNAKINIGLNITSKRPDGYHNIETVFYPISLCDVLEFVENNDNTTKIKTTGINLEIPDNQNICIKAYELLAKDFRLPSLSIYLHKVIPSGAGLGGGSADAAFFIKFLNANYNLGISDEQLENYASKIGSDCPFFIRNKPVYAYEKGNVFEKINLDLKNLYLYLVKPDISVSTPMAYSKVVPQKPDHSVKQLIQKPVNDWKELIFNDFEKSVFAIYPQLAAIKSEFYNQGAVYASMSGSGSSVYGIFIKEPQKIKSFDSYFNFIAKL